MPQSEWKPFHQNDNWSQRLILARECFSEIRAERTEDSPAGSPNVQGPYILAQIQDETIVDIASLSDAELDAMTAPKASAC